MKGKHMIAAIYHLFQPGDFTRLNVRLATLSTPLKLMILYNDR